MTEPWFVPLGPATDGVRLVVFPHAGAGPASLGRLTSAFAETEAGIEAWSVSLPGRQARANEIPRSDPTTLLDELAEHLEPLMARRCVLFGYCGGALLSYLVARAMERAGRPPLHLVVGSAPAPDLGVYPRRLHLLPSSEFWDEVLAQGGVPEELADRVELRPLFEPAIRADFSLLASYRHRRLPPLSCGITVLYGRSDASVHRGRLRGWRRQTSGTFAMRGLPCSHWLVDEAPDAVARSIGEEILACHSFS